MGFFSRPLDGLLFFSRHLDGLLFKALGCWASLLFKALGWTSFRDGLLFELGFFSRLFLQTQEVGFFLDECCKF